MRLIAAMEAVMCVGSPASPLTAPIKLPTNQAAEQTATRDVQQRARHTENRMAAFEAQLQREIDQVLSVVDDPQVGGSGGQAGESKVPASCCLSWTRIVQRCAVARM